MSISIPAVSQSAHVAPAAPSPKTTSKTATHAPAAAASDSVALSSAAQAALKEATESAADTAKEANHGDRQAQRLLARENAARNIEK